MKVSLWRACYSVCFILLLCLCVLQVLQLLIIYPPSPNPSTSTRYSAAGQRARYWDLVKTQINLHIGRDLPIEICPICKSSPICKRFESWPNPNIPLSVEPPADETRYWDEDLGLGGFVILSVLLVLLLFLYYVASRIHFVQSLLPCFKQCLITPVCLQLDSLWYTLDSGYMFHIGTRPKVTINLKWHYFRNNLLYQKSILFGTKLTIKPKRPYIRLSGIQCIRDGL